MENSLFGDYSFSEFIEEFFTTLIEVLSGVFYAFWQIFHDIGPLKVILSGYVFLLLLAVVSELKKNHRKREAEHRAYQAARDAQRAQEQRRKEEREERINQFKQRDAKRGAAKGLPAGVTPRGQGSSPQQHSRPGQRGH